MIEFIIDNRENLLKLWFENQLKKQTLDDGKFIKPTYQKLLIGDIQINHPNITIILERKTMKDLAASIKDGRYKEQKARMLANKQPNMILIYIIEGYMERRDMKDDKVNGIPMKTLISSMLNSMIRDNIYVYKTFTHQETCRTLQILCNKLLNNPETFIPEKILELPKQAVQAKIEDFNYSEVIKLKKKDNLTPEVCFITQLSQIPRISNNSAKQIVEKYKTMINFCREWEKYKETSDKPELYLKDFEITGKNGKQRKLGKKASTKLYNYLFGIVAE